MLIIQRLIVFPSKKKHASSVFPLIFSFETRVYLLLRIFGDLNLIKPGIYTPLQWHRVEESDEAVLTLIIFNTTVLASNELL